VSTKVISITDEGIRFVYDDRLRGLLNHGQASISRASHVNPDADLTWHADLSPIGGPVIRGFPTRDAALAAETEWINEHILEDLLPQH
jgi:hypothetical protein